MSTIGERIKDKRIERGYSQQDLANRMGYKSRSTINKIEMGKNDIPLSKVIAFANSLGTTPEYLMGWEDVPERHDGLYDMTGKPEDLPGLTDLDRELIARLRQLSPEEWKQVDAFVQGLLAHR